MIRELSSCVGESYLLALEELTLELQRAMAAVRTGALSDFEQTLHHQQIICARLAALKGLEYPAPERIYTASTSANAMLAERIHIATDALRAVIREYSMLLKHFSATARLFAGAFPRYGGASAAILGMQTSRSSWSCEL